MIHCAEDADELAVRHVADRFDISQPITVDFSVRTADQAGARELAREAAARGYRVSMEFDRRSGACTCHCSKSLLLSYESVLAAQHELEQLAAPMEGQCIGWGTLGQGDLGASDV